MFSQKNSDQEKLNSLRLIRKDIESKPHQSTSDQVIIEALGSYASTLTELFTEGGNEFPGPHIPFRKTEGGNEFPGTHIPFRKGEKINNPPVATDQEKLNLLQSIKGDIESKPHPSTSDQVIIEALGRYASTLTKLVTEEDDEFLGHHGPFTKGKIDNQSQIYSDK